MGRAEITSSYDVTLVVPVSSNVLGKQATVLYIILLALASRVAIGPKSTLRGVVTTYYIKHVAKNIDTPELRRHLQGSRVRALLVLDVVSFETLRLDCCVRSHNRRSATRQLLKALVIHCTVLYCTVLLYCTAT